MAIGEALPDCFDCKYGGLEHPCRCADGSYDFAKAAAALIERGRRISPDDDEGPPELDPDDWITDCEYELVEDHPDLVIPLIVTAMDVCQTPDDAAYLAAGLIENALVKHGAKLIGDIETLAAGSAKVRYILSGVWSQGGSIAPDVWTRLGRAIGASQRMSDDGRSASDGSPVSVLDENKATALLAERVAPLAKTHGLLRRP